MASTNNFVLNNILRICSSSIRQFSRRVSFVDVGHENDDIDSSFKRKEEADKSVSTKILHIGLCGAPNSGKSTLLNSLVGKKLSAVSHKVNTTRDGIMGVKVVGNTQLIFHDTPGLIQKSGSSREEKELTGVAKNILSNMDIFLTINDGSIPLTHLSKEVIHTALALSQKNNSGLIFAINKADLMKSRESITERRRQIAEEIPLVLRPEIRLNDDGSNIHVVSAMLGDGIKGVETELLQLAKRGKWVLSAGTTTNRTQEEQASEVIREKVFHYLNQEIPYEIIFQHQGWKRNNDYLVLEEALIVQSPSQQKIVSKVRGRLEQEAATDLSLLFNRKIKVVISVNVEKE